LLNKKKSPVVDAYKYNVIIYLYVFVCPLGK
jgi:hypothetical protein